MLQVAAFTYLEIGRLIQDWLQGPLAISSPEDPLTGQTYVDFVDAISVLKVHSDSLGLEVTEQVLSDKLRSLNGQTLTRFIAGDTMGEIYRCFLAELKSKTFFFVPSHKAKYYYGVIARWPDPATSAEPVVLQTPLFGEQVAENFRSASYDIKEAATCYAVGRNTACVFHLMRVLEIGLGVLGKVFGVSLAHTNWAPAIEQIENKIREMHKDPAWKVLPDYKDQQEFYAQAASHFGVLKDAWRNYTAHARGRYDEDEAEAILRNVGGFMKRLALRLREEETL